MPNDSPIQEESPIQAELNDGLFSAAASGSSDFAARLLSEGADPNAGFSRALRLAAKYGHVECVKLLAGISDPNSMECHALCLASVHGHAECVGLLIARSESVHGRASSLSLAAENGHVECVKILLRHARPMLDASLLENPRPLHLAIASGRAGAVALMLSHEPALIENIDLQQALLDALERGHHDLGALFLSISEKRVISSSADAAGASSSMPSTRL